MPNPLKQNTLNYEMVYSYEAEKGGALLPPNSAKVDYCYFPVLSPAHPAVAELSQLDEEYGGLENVPPQALPKINNLAVLVKTEKYKTIGALPDTHLSSGSSVQGLVINEVDSLKKEEKKLVQQGFPTLNLDEVLIVEQGRKPAPLGKSMGMILGGGLAIAGGVFVMFKRRRT